MPNEMESSWDGGAIYCEATCRSEERVYEGSDDEDYDSPESRRLQYEAVGRRYLDGTEPFILTASLRGPFDRDSGWTNPWRSKHRTARGQQGTRTSPQKPLNRKGVQRKTSIPETQMETQDSLECHLPSPESLKQPSVTDSHPFLEDEELAMVQNWRHAVQPLSLVKEAFWASTPKKDTSTGKRRAQGSEWLHKLTSKRRRTDIMESGSIDTPANRRSGFSKFSPENAEPVMPQNISFRSTPTILPSATPKPLPYKQRSVSAPVGNETDFNDQVTGMADNSASSAPSQPSFSSEHLSPENSVPVFRNNWDQDLRDEQSQANLKAAASLSSPKSEKESRMLFQKTSSLDASGNHPSRILEPSHLEAPDEICDSSFLQGVNDAHMQQDHVDQGIGHEPSEAFETQNGQSFYFRMRSRPGMGEEHLGETSSLFEAPSWSDLSPERNDHMPIMVDRGSLQSKGGEDPDHASADDQPENMEMAPASDNNNCGSNGTQKMPKELFDYSKQDLQGIGSLEGENDGDGEQSAKSESQWLDGRDAHGDDAAGLGVLVKVLQGKVDVVDVAVDKDAAAELRVGHEEVSHGHQQLPGSERNLPSPTDNAEGTSGEIIAPSGHSAEDIDMDLSECSAPKDNESPGSMLDVSTTAVQQGHVRSSSSSQISGGIRDIGTDEGHMDIASTGSASNHVPNGDATQDQVAPEQQDHSDSCPTEEENQDVHNNKPCGRSSEAGAEDSRDTDPHPEVTMQPPRAIVDNADEDEAPQVTSTDDGSDREDTSTNSATKDQDFASAANEPRQDNKDSQPIPMSQQSPWTKSTFSQCAALRIDGLPNVDDISDPAITPQKCDGLLPAPLDAQTPWVKSTVDTATETGLSPAPLDLPDQTPASETSDTCTPTIKEGGPVVVTPSVRSKPQEPRFSAISFSSFHTPSPKWPSRSWTQSRVRLSNSRGYLSSAMKDPSGEKKPERRVSWAPLPGGDEDYASSPVGGEGLQSSDPENRPASPPLEISVSELATTEGHRFEKHFNAVAKRTHDPQEPPAPFPSQQSLNSLEPNAMAETFLAADQVRTAEPAKTDDIKNLQPELEDSEEDDSQETYDLVAEVFSEMGEMIKNWDVDEELEKARSQGNPSSSRLGLGLHNPW